MVTITVTVAGSLVDANAGAGVAAGSAELLDAPAPEGVIVLPCSSNVSVVRTAFCAMKVVACPSVYQLKAILPNHKHTFKAPFLRFGKYRNGIESNRGWHSLSPRNGPCR